VLPAFCRVAATLRPTSDSDIKIEVWMPASGWNGKFQAVGNGAFNGSIAYPSMMTALARGYATSSTDTGHTGNTAAFAPGHPEKVIDFGWRAVHEMTLAARQVIAAYYDSAEVLLLERLLGRRPSGDEGGAALPGGFRRHHRRRAGLDWTGRATGGTRDEGAGSE
jgi:Tannase and feruloyl esterase.